MRAVRAGEVADPAASIAAALLPPSLAEALGTLATLVEVSAFRVAKVAGEAEIFGGRPSTEHPEITARDWALLQRLVATGEAHLDLGRYRQLVLHGRPDAATGRMLMLIIRAVRRPDGGERLIVPTFQQSGRRRRARKLRGLKAIMR